MLTLMPLSGLQTALKRRNSKTYDFSRRGSLSVYTTYSLPTSKSYMRRFSSFEELAPIFNLLTPPPEKTVIKKMSSFRRRSSRKSSSCSESSEECETKCCEELDSQIAKIKKQLSQLKNEDIELAQRVDDLHSSVNDMCKTHNIDPSAQEEVLLERKTSSNSLSVIRESSVEVVDDDGSDSEDESFEEYCKATLPKIGARSTPLSFRPLNVLPGCEVADPKRHCLLNNTLRTKVKSSPQLNLIRNDLSDESSGSSCRLSIISV